MAYTIQSLSINGAVDEPSITFGSNVLSFPATTDGVVTLSEPQTLFQKVLMTPTIASLRNGESIINIPQNEDTLVNQTSSQNLTNKTLIDPVIKDGNDNIIVIPPGADTLVNLSGSQVLSGKTLVAPILKDGADHVITIPSGADTLVNLNSSQVLSNKTLSNPILKDGSGNTITIPSGTDTLVNLAGSQTMSNKSLTSPVINGVTITGTPTTGQVLQATSGSAASWGSLDIPYTTTVTTNDGTATTIATITGADNVSYLVTVNVVGNRTTGGTEAFGEVLRCMYKRNTGAATMGQVGADNSIILYGGILGPTATWGVASSADTTNGNILIKVTGQTGKTVSWKALVQIVSL